MRALKLSHRIGRVAAAAGFGVVATLGLTSAAAAHDSGTIQGDTGTSQSEHSGSITPDETKWE